MIRFSAVLVVVATGMLVVGVVTSDLKLVYVAIGVSSVALLALGAGWMLKRDELLGQGAAAESVPSQSRSDQPAAVPVVAGGASAEPMWGAAFSASASGHVGASASAAQVAAAAPASAWPAAPNTAAPNTSAPNTSAPNTSERSSSGRGGTGWPGEAERSAGGEDRWWGLPAAGRFDTRPAATYAASATPPVSGTPPVSAAPDVSSAPKVPDHADVPDHVDVLADDVGEADEPTEAETDAVSDVGDAALVADASAEKVAGTDDARTESEQPIADAGPTDEADAVASVDGEAPLPGSLADPLREVTVVPGVPRYHNASCILIRFMGDDGLEKMTLAAAQQAGCTPCRACLPDQEAAG